MPEELEKIIIRIGEKKPNLRMNGGEKLHPIYEAVLALLRQNLTDSQIMKVMQDGGDIRKVFALDYIAGYIPESKRGEFQRQMESQGYSELVNLASLYIAENKRIHDGNAIQPVSDFGNQKYFLRALKNASPREVYIQSKSVPELQAGAEKIRKRRIRRGICLGILLAALPISAIYSYKTYESKVDIEQRAKELYQQNLQLRAELRVAEEAQ